MFLINRKGMETLQMVILGLLLAALAVVFVSRFSGGVRTAGSQIGNAQSTTGNRLENVIGNLE